MNKMGVTPIELVIIVSIIGTLAIIGILAGIAIPAYKRYQAGDSFASDPYIPRTACVNGFAYTIDYNGNVTQQFNEFGGGVRCH